jgi:hypothetical protein
LLLNFIINGVKGREHWPSPFLYPMPMIAVDPGN